MCPNCGKPAFGFRKKQLSKRVTELAYECRNPTCRGSFVFHGEVNRWLTLPAHLDPKLDIPLSPFIQRRQQIEALNNLQTANVTEADELIAHESGSQIDIFHGLS